MANLKPVLIALAVFAALWLLGELLLTLIVADTLGCPPPPPSGGAFGACALTWWHAIDGLLLLVVCAQLASMPSSERRRGGDEGMPAWLPAFLAVVALAADLCVAAARYSLVTPLTWSLWQWWIVLLLDLLLVFTVGGVLVVQLALLMGLAARFAR